jgi:glycosyltransferase involved in cell wall biosynthesis
MTQSLESPSGLGRFFPVAKALVQRGNDVTILTLHHDYANCTCRDFVRDGVRVRYLGQMHVHKIGDTKHYFHPLKLIWVVLWATVRLSWVGLRSSAERIHLCKPQPMNSIAAWLILRLRGTPVLLDSDDFEAIHNQFVGRWQQRIVATFENWAATFADQIIAGNRFVAAHYTARGYPPDRLTIVYNGVDRARFSELTKLAPLTVPFLREQTIVYVGSMRLHSHAVDLLLAAFQQVQQTTPAARLVLFGGGVDLEKLHKLAAELGIDEFVHFAGRIAGEQVPLAYQAGVISADPRRNSDAAASSFSLKMVESIAAGVPCVTTDVGDRRAMLGSAGMAVAPDDVDALAAGLRHFLCDPAALAAAQRACLTQRAELFWDQKVDQYIR